jgi:hypothetical protein
MRKIKIYLIVICYIVFFNNILSYSIGFEEGSNSGEESTTSWITTNPFIDFQNGTST